MPKYIEKPSLAFKNKCLTLVSTFASVRVSRDKQSPTKGIQAFAVVT